MHAEALRRPQYRDEGLGRAVGLAVGLHLALLLILLVAPYLPFFSRPPPPAAGAPVIEAALVISDADVRAAEQAAREAPEPVPEPITPPPLPEPVLEDTVPPPQPEPVRAPQDAPTPPQPVAQERIPVPDTTDQERASRLAIAEEKARQEQEARRRQEQIDLTERQRQEEAENRRRQAAQQAEAERQQKLAEIRRQREQAERERRLAEQRLRQLADARARQAAAAEAAAQEASPPPGQGGVNDDLANAYAQAIQQAVLRQWVRPDTVPLGQRCRVTIRQVPGGEVIDVQVAPGCPYDAAGQRSLEAAILRAQPLPYRGFENVFQRTLIFNFEARDR